MLVIWLLLFFVTAGAQSPPVTKAPAPAQNLILKDIQGRKFSVSEYKGQVVLVNFWATWCAPCRAEIPDLVKLQKRYRTQGLRVIGVTYPPQTVSQVKRFARRLRMNYRLALGTAAVKELLTSSNALPVTVVIDRDGTLREVIEGVMYADEFDQKVKPLLVNAPANK